MVLGGLATVDFFDCRDALPWMWKDRTWGLELLSGGLFAVAVPVVLATLLWWGRWRAGVIFGIGLAFLLHVTLAIVVLLSLYTLAENVVKPRSFKQVCSPWPDWPLPASAPSTSCGPPGAAADGLSS